MKLKWTRPMQDSLRRLILEMQKLKQTLKQRQDSKKQTA
jgi:hypothetical protein